MLFHDVFRDLDNMEFIGVPAMITLLYCSLGGPAGE
jgi:hypothetical protein